jgi:hypothetical protein
MAKRPTRLYIEPFTYSLEARPGWSEATGNMGNCLKDSQQLIIDPGLSDQAERDTVLHEALHALWSQTGLQKEYTEEQEEGIVWQLTPRLLGFLKDNPEFVKWLLGR